MILLLGTNHKETISFDRLERRQLKCMGTSSEWVLVVGRGRCTNEHRTEEVKGKAVTLIEEPSDGLNIEGVMK